MLCNLQEFLAVTDYQTITGNFHAADQSRVVKWDLMKHNKDGGVIAKLQMTLSMEDSAELAKELEAGYERRLRSNALPCPEGWTSARAFLLYDCYFKNIFPGTYTIQQAEKAIEKMIEDEMLPPQAYEHVAQSRGWGKRHKKKNHRGSDCLSDKGRKREVKKAFERSDQPGSYIINKLSNKVGSDIVAYIAEKEFVVEYFFPIGFWEKHVTRNNIINITPFPKRKGDYWYEGFGKAFVLEVEKT